MPARHAYDRTLSVLAASSKSAAICPSIPSHAPLLPPSPVEIVFPPK